MNSGTKTILTLAGIAVSFATGAWLGGESTLAGWSSAGKAANRKTAHSTAAGSSALSSAFDSGSPRTAKLWLATQEPPGPWRAYHLAEAIEGLNGAETIEALERTRRLGGNLQKDLVELLMKHAQRIAPAELLDYVKPMALREVPWATVNDFDGRVVWAWLTSGSDDAIRFGVDQNVDSIYLVQGWGRKVAGQVLRGETVKLPEGLDITMQEKLLNAATSAVAVSDTEAALSLARQIRGRQRRMDSVREALSWIAEKDSNRALKELRTELASGAENANGAMIGRVFGKLAESDPVAALKEADALGEAWRDSAREAVYLTWAAKDPLKALDAARDDGELRARMRLNNEYGFREQTVVAAAMAKNSKGTLDWIRSLPPGEERTEVLIEALNATREIGASLEEFKSELPTDWQTELRTRVAVSAGDVKELQAALAGLPDPVSRSEAITRWARNCPFPQSGQEFLAQFPDTADRDAAALSIVNRLVPRSGLEIAEQVHSPDLRARAFQDIALKWLENDTDAARKWIDSTPELSPESKAFVIRKSAEKLLKNPPRFEF